MSDERMISARGKQWAVAGDIVIAVAFMGLIGAGNIGSQLARLAVAHGYDVVISNSRGPETLTTLVAELGLHARAATGSRLRRPDIVVVTIPLPAHLPTSEARDRRYG